MPSSPPPLPNGSPKLPPHSLKHGPSSPADPRHPRDTTPSSMAPSTRNLVWKKHCLRGPCSQRTPEPGPVLAFFSLPGRAVPTLPRCLECVIGGLWVGRLLVRLS
ncbi:hypothetical protein LZ31DRAFT_264153 [Colletotrichum somersetense]|nr:hypothetical protein LZ31DRAFT_264153 [Colletotrichum somersetense]